MTHLVCVELSACSLSIKVWKWSLPVFRHVKMTSWYEYIFKMLNWRIPFLEQLSSSLQYCCLMVNKAQLNGTLSTLSSLQSSIQVKTCFSQHLFNKELFGYMWQSDNCIFVKLKSLFSKLYNCTEVNNEIKSFKKKTKPKRDWFIFTNDYVFKLLTWWGPALNILKLLKKPEEEAKLPLALDGLAVVWASKELKNVQQKKWHQGTTGATV